MRKVMMALVLLGCALAHPSTAPDVMRKGNMLIDRKTGTAVVLKGVPYMGGEYMCAHGAGIFNGPSNQTIVDAWKDWGINAVRLPMNEDCWLGINGVPAKFSGTNYQQAFKDFTSLLLANGIVVVLDLHWTNHTEGGLAIGQDLMLSETSVKFWADVASQPEFKDIPGVVFELFNEPHGFYYSPHLPSSCFLDGQNCGDSYQGFVGYNNATRAVRETANASNLILYGGPNWDFQLDWLLEPGHMPTDPLSNFAISWHPYEKKQWSSFTCSDFKCENLTTPITKEYPMLVTEWGPLDANAVDAYVTNVYSWADAHPGSVHIFPWVWHPGKVWLLQADSDYYGSKPSAWGESYKVWDPNPNQTAG
jgi:hypothetical protein